MAIGTGALIDLCLNPRVHDVAERLITSVYGRIFKDTKILALTGPAKEQPATDRQLLERLVESQPTNAEMAVAFALLQAELRRGQQRLWLGLTAFSVPILILLMVIIVR